MSWSFGPFNGTPAMVKAAFNKYGDSLTGNSRYEFDEVRKHVEAVIDQNFDRRADARPFGVCLEANGTGQTMPQPTGVVGGKPEPVERVCQVRVTHLFGYRADTQSPTEVAPAQP